VEGESGSVEMLYGREEAPDPPQRLPSHDVMVYCLVVVVDELMILVQSNP